MDRETLLSQLDDDQRAAVTAPLSNILCVANAGSGKTRVLTYRIAYWIMEGVPQDSFLMLTFTNKAAAEMMERIRKLINSEEIYLTGGTFHSIACRLLRKWGPVVDVDSNFIILSEKDAADLMGVCREKFCAAHEFARDEFAAHKVNIMALYSYARNCCLSLAEANTIRNMVPDELLELVEQELIPDYEECKRKRKGLDFDDLLVKFNELLDAPQASRWFHSHFPHVFVDEYQDINQLQDNIIHKLVKGVNRLTAVGDEAQCIYGFRGSNVEFIRNFTTDYPDAAVYSIRNNYRSLESVVDLALQVINDGEYGRAHPKEMFATHTGPQVPQVNYYQEDLDQAFGIAKEIMSLHRDGTPYNEMAVLVRANRLGKDLEVGLTKSGIPVRMECGIRFFDRAHIRIAMYFLRTLYNPHDDLAFWALMDTVYGVGPQTIKKIFAAFEGHNFEFAQLYGMTVKKNAQADFSNLARTLVRAEKHTNMVEQIDIFLEMRGKNYLMRKFKDWKKRLADFDILKQTLADFDSIQEFLNEAALDEKRTNAPDGKDAVTITTVHRSKGLEWDTVFLPYMNEGTFPSINVSEKEDFDEERRLLYVAVTRARRDLFISKVTVSNSVLKPELSSLLYGVRIHEGPTASSEFDYPEAC